MISSRDQRRIFLLPGRPDQSRNPGYKTFHNGKTRPAKPPDAPTILIGAAHISFSGQHRISQATSKTNPQVSPRWPRRKLSSDQHSKEHWPAGAKIKMTLGLRKPKGKRARWQMLKTMVGPCWRSFIQRELSRGSHKSPNRVRNAK